MNIEYKKVILKMFNDQFGKSNYKIKFSKGIHKGNYTYYVLELTPYITEYEISRINRLNQCFHKYSTARFSAQILRIEDEFFLQYKENY